MHEHTDFSFGYTTPAIRLASAPVKQRLMAHVSAWVSHCKAEGRMIPKLAIVLVGNDPASAIYVSAKQKACHDVGLACDIVRFEDSTSEVEVAAAVDKLAADNTITGILVQLPLPQGWDVQAMLNRVPVAKDADGLCDDNFALCEAGDKRAIWPATPLGVMRLLAGYEIEVAGKTACVVGRSRVVGLPLAALLQQAGAKAVVTIDKDTENPAEIAHQADILCSATGVTGLVTGAWIKPGAVVIDIGITRTPEGLRGDVVAEDAQKIASALTPVPGGVGPLTVTSLLTNLVDCACLQGGEPRVEW